MTMETKSPLDRVLDLAERQLDQDKRALSGPSITQGMMADVTADQEALMKVRSLKARLGREGVEGYIYDMWWTSEATDWDKALVAGNIRTFAEWLREGNS